MSGVRRHNWDAVLDMWAEGGKAREIEAVFGIGRGHVPKIIYRMRQAGDPRAIYHVTSLPSEFWTGEKVDQLRALWARDTLSAAEIANVIGAPSRNAVLGKAHRLRLPLKKKAPVRRHVRARSHAVKPAFVKPKPRPLPLPRPRPVSPDENPIEIPVAVMLSIMELTDHTCKFPIGDPREPGFGFCGHPPTEGKPYCAYHCRVAYAPPERRERRKFVVLKRGTFEAAA